MYKQIIMIVSLLVVSACGPRLEQVVDYIPPTTNSGLACIQKAQTMRQQCQMDNSERVKACVDAAREESYQLLPQLEQQYTSDLERYIDLQDEFEMARKSFNEQQRLILRDGELAYIRCSNDVNMTQVSKFPKCKRHLDEARQRADQLVAPYAPIRPERPRQDLIFRDLSKNCSSLAINCTTGFDEAYISCGGRIERSMVCVENCN